MNKRRAAAFAQCLTAAGLVAHLGAADPIVSRWRTAEMKVDGAVTEFQTLSWLQEGVAVTAANDADVLQLALKTSDPSIRQRLMTAGLVVYLDPTNKKKETFGIRVPRLGGPPMPDAAPAGPQVTHVEVLGPAKDELHIVELNEPSGIEAAAGNQEGSLVLELLIPLHTREGARYAVGVPAGQRTIGLGLVTPDPPDTTGGRSGPGRRGGRGADGPQAQGASPQGGMGGGGMGRGGGMPGGGMGRGGEGRGRESMAGKALKAWTTIELASPAK